MSCSFKFPNVALLSMSQLPLLKNRKGDDAGGGRTSSALGMISLGYTPDSSHCFFPPCLSSCFPLNASSSTADLKELAPHKWTNLSGSKNSHPSLDSERRRQMAGSALSSSDLSHNHSRWDGHSRRPAACCVDPMLRLRRRAPPTSSDAIHALCSSAPIKPHPVRYALIN